MRAAIYARVSTVDQNCEMQLRELRAYCRRRGWPIAGEYADAGWSGAKASRPQLNRLKKDARARQFDVVLVWTVDRWGRSMIDLLTNVQELVSLGIRWIAVTQNLDTDESNPMSRAMLQMMAVFAELERELIRERVTAGVKNYRQAYKSGRIGKDRHSHSGKNLPVGRPKRVFDRDLVRDLRRKGMSIRQIAEKMDLSVGTVHGLLKPA